MLRIFFFRPENMLRIFFFRPETSVVREGHEGEVRRQSLSENIFCQLEIINTIIMLMISTLSITSKHLKAFCEWRVLNFAARLKWRNTIEERTGQTALQGRNSFLFFLSKEFEEKDTAVLWWEVLEFWTTLIFLVGELLRVEGAELGINILPRRGRYFSCQPTCRGQQ